MRQVKYSLVAALAIAATLNASEDLGLITVESSIIDDKFDAKKLEVSNTVTLKGSEVEEHHAENIADVLNNIPGVTVRKNEGDSNKIHIRGVAGEVYMGEKPGVAIVIDGVPVQERAGSVNIDIDNIESVKVIKGGASYLYGNDALAGAVIITTKRPKAKNEGFVAVEAGSYGYEKYLANYMGSTEDFAIQLQASYKASDGYWEDSDYWAKSFNGKFQYYIDETSDITFGVDKSTRYENDSGAITHTTYNPDTEEYTNQVETNPTSIGEVGYSTDYDIDLSKYFITYSKDFDNNSNLMTQIYSYEDTTTNKSGMYDSNRDGIRDDHLYDAYANTLQNGLKSEYRMDSDKLAYMVGLDIARNEEDKNRKYRVDYTGRDRVLHSIGEVTSDTNNKEDINAIYGELKYKINDKLVTTLNARFDNIEYDYTNNLTSETWNKDFNEGSYRLGATYKLEENQIFYGSVSSGFRVPTISQLYAGDILSGRYAYENNPDIETEKTYNYELGYRGKNDLITYDVAIFQLDRKDVILRNGGNYVADPNSRRNPIMYGNFADVQNRGLELSLNSDRSKEFSFVVNYAYLDSKYTRYDEYKLVLHDTDLDKDYVEGTYDLDGNTVPRTSKHTIYLEGNYRVTPNWMFTAGVNYRSSQYADEMNEIKVDGYSVANLRTIYNTKVSDFDMEFFAIVDNLFDEQYFMMPRATGDRNDDGYYDLRDMGLTVNPGRVYTVGLSMKF
ncbi:MAG: TonB-dependent receptor [Sulfurovum sp.]|nr:MAG: TonB-dependent receptor [Sulfurovum sp.]